MTHTSDGPEALARLRIVKDRVRSLAQEHHGFASALRASCTNFLDLCRRYRKQCTALNDLKRGLARSLLLNHRLTEVEGGEEPLWPPAVHIYGLCPVDLALRLAQYYQGEQLPAPLQQESAAAALAALDRQIIYSSPDLAEEEAAKMAADYRDSAATKTFVEYEWHILVARPANCVEPPDPGSLNRADLEQFSTEDYRTIVLYRLGGLADVGAIRPIVPKPAGKGAIEDVVAYGIWRSRFPIDNGDLNSNEPRLSPDALPASIAEQMLVHVETWICDRKGADCGSNHSNPAPAVKVTRKPTEGERGQAEQPKEVVLWEGASPTPRNIELARTRTAYLEAHGKVSAALKARKAEGNGISRSAFYTHLVALDKEIPGWRNDVLMSSPSGNLENMHITRTHRKP